MWTDFVLFRFGHPFFQWSLLRLILKIMVPVTLVVVVNFDIIVWWSFWLLVTAKVTGMIRNHIYCIKIILVISTVNLWTYILSLQMLNIDLYDTCDEVTSWNFLKNNNFNCIFILLYNKNQIHFTIHSEIRYTGSSIYRISWYNGFLKNFY